MANLRNIHTKLNQIQKAWAIDPLRVHQPEFQLSHSIEKLINRIFPNEASLSSPKQLAIKPDDSKLQGAQKILNSLESLSSGSISKKYPFPESMKNPASFPNHYGELKEGVDRAIRGESLPWYKRWIRFR